jgi:hypothetical protein
MIAFCQDQCDAELSNGSFILRAGEFYGISFHATFITLFM